MTWRQLEDAQETIVQGHRDRSVSTMLKGVVANMRILCKFSREAGFLPYIGHAHYIYECYLKSQINSAALLRVAISERSGLFRLTWTRTCQRHVP